MFTAMPIFACTCLFIITFAICKVVAFDPFDFLDREEYGTEDWL